MATYQALSTVQKAHKYIDAWNYHFIFAPNNIFCISTAGHIKLEQKRSQ